MLLSLKVVAKRKKMVRSDLHNKSGKFTLHICNMNPYIYDSGTEKYIVAQVDELQKKEIKSIILFPVLKGHGKVSLRAWGVVTDRKLKRMISYGDVIAYINDALRDNECVGVFVHGLMYADLNELYGIISFRENVIIFLHDYYSCCIQFNLLKNGINYCGSGRLYKDKCEECKYYNKSKKRKEQIIGLFRKIRKPYFIAPSEIVKQIWIDVYPEYTDYVAVIGHTTPVGRYEGNNNYLNLNDKLKIAFVGRDHPNKGYLLWEKALSIMPISDLNVELYHFGKASKRIDGVKNIEINITKDGADAMTNALRKHEISVVLLLSICPETYSYTYFEAMAANCFIIANRMSGNIAEQVKKNQNGIVIENTVEALAEVLQNTKELVKSINRFRSSEYVAPETMKNNTEYMELLKSESNDSIKQNERVFLPRRINAMLCKKLYLWRHRSKYERQDFRHYSRL